MTAPITSRAFLRAYVVTMRPYLLFVSGLTGLAGMAAAPTAPLALTLLVATVFFLGYGFGQALTDCFQTDTDALSAPYRPLVRGTVRRRDVLLVSLAGLALSGVVITLRNLWNLPLAALAVFGLWAYTWFKHRWWGGPPWNAWIVALLSLMGYLTQAGRGTTPFALPTALGWIALAAFFGYANFVLVGYYKDISADRATGYRTLPVAFGLRVSAWVSDVLALTALYGWHRAVRAGVGGPWIEAPLATWVFGIAGLGAVIWAQVLQHRVRDESQAHRAIALVVHGYVLWFAAVTAALRPAWTVALALCYAAFVVAMRARPERSQI